MVRKAMLVYQAGIANIFEVEEFNLSADSGRKARRIYQGDFRTAEALSRGMNIAGCAIQIAACNQAGEIVNSVWTYDLKSQPFSDQFRRCEFAGEPKVDKRESRIVKDLKELYPKTWPTVDNTARCMGIILMDHFEFPPATGLHWTLERAEMGRLQRSQVEEWFQIAIGARFLHGHVTFKKLYEAGLVFNPEIE